MRFLFAILMLCGCAATAPHGPTASKISPLPPMPTVKESLTTQVRAKYAQATASESIQLPAKPLTLRWDDTNPFPVTFRIYEKSDLLLPWTLIGDTATNSYQITADKPFGFYTVSAVQDGIEVFATK